MGLQRTCVRFKKYKGVYRCETFAKPGEKVRGIPVTIHPKPCPADMVSRSPGLIHPKAKPCHPGGLAPKAPRKAKKAKARRAKKGVSSFKRAVAKKVRARIAKMAKREGAKRYSRTAEASASSYLIGRITPRQLAKRVKAKRRAAKAKR